MACGIFPDQGSTWCPLYWQAEVPQETLKGGDNEPLPCNLRRVNIYKTSAILAELDLLKSTMENRDPVTEGKQTLPKVIQTLAGSIPDTDFSEWASESLADLKLLSRKKP